MSTSAKSTRSWRPPLAKAKEIPGTNGATRIIPRWRRHARRAGCDAGNVHGCVPIQGAYNSATTLSRRRQEDLNEAYDALMDMAAILGIPPKATSLERRTRARLWSPWIRREECVCCAL